MINKDIKPKTHLLDPVILTNQAEVCVRKGKKRKEYEERKSLFQEGFHEMLALCGVGYWVQGFRCFPWLALNFHMAHSLNLHPSTLQLAQNSGNLPMVAKPLYGILSDALYIRGAHRMPYICIGVLLQVLSWGQLALIPVACQALPTLMACVLLSNLGASITEVAKDALVTEYGQKQSYWTPVLCLHGFSCWWDPRQLTRGQSDLMIAIGEDSISRPLTWIVASIAMVPILSGSIFCYQTQCLHLDPSVIGMSRVIGQLVLLSLIVLYDRYWKHIPMRKLVGAVQILPFSVLLATLCPCGCEGSLTSFLASALCLSSIFSGFWGVGLAALLGIKSSDYSNLAVGILIEFLAALLPLGWIHQVPMSVPVEKERKIVAGKRTRRNRRIGRVVIGPVPVYSREREPEAQK
ncbi:hypothetical protein PTKIN_Ptkin10aG0030400 [Pterospermum kingtungense]